MYKTNFDKIRGYYQQFDEWGRLDTPAGKLEYFITLKLIEEYVPLGSYVLDLGGGPGRYTLALASKGYHMFLADISPDLIRFARNMLEDFLSKDFIHGMEVVNAIDLSVFSNESFDAVLLLGPLYHLTDIEEVISCLREVYRILKPSGKIVAAFIPHMSGLSGIIHRALRKPDQVDTKVLRNTYENGIFNNLSTNGFQEGKYIQKSTLMNIVNTIGFEKLLIRSIRGLGMGQEEQLLELAHKDPTYFQDILEVIHLTASQPSVIETCGHALYIGEKPQNNRTIPDEISSH